MKSRKRSCRKVVSSRGQRNSWFDLQKFCGNFLRSISILWFTFKTCAHSIRYCRWNFFSSCFQINSLKTTSKNFHSEPQIFACFQSAKHFFFMSNFCAGWSSEGDGVWLEVFMGILAWKFNCDSDEF
jgi:hypothetical protein